MPFCKTNSCSNLFASIVDVGAKCYVKNDVANWMPTRDRKMFNFLHVPKSRSEFHYHTITFVWDTFPFLLRLCRFFTCIFPFSKPKSSLDGVVHNTDPFPSKYYADTKHQGEKNIWSSRSSLNLMWRPSLFKAFESACFVEIAADKFKSPAFPPIQNGGVLKF